MEKSTRRRRESFLQDLRFELLLAGHSFQFLPAEGTPNQIAVAAQIWEDGLTKDAFMRVMQQVVNGLILIVWSAEEGAGYLSQSRKARRPRTKE